MDGKVLMDDLQASLYVDFNVTQPNRYNYHKQLFIPSSLYETPGLEIVDWSILRATVNSTLKSRSSRADGEDTGLNIVKIYGATEKSEFVIATCSNYYFCSIVFGVWIISPHPLIVSRESLITHILLLFLQNQSCGYCPVSTGRSSKEW